MKKIVFLCLACLLVSGEPAMHANPSPFMLVQAPQAPAPGNPGPQDMVIGGDDFYEWTIGGARVENPSLNSAVSWTIFPVYPLPEDAASMIFVNGGVNFTGPPGRYKVLCTEVTINDNRPNIRQGIKIITIHPQRGQNQRSANKMELACIIVEQPGSNTRNAYMDNVALQDYLRAHGHVLRFANTGNANPSSDWQPYIERARGKTLPYLTVIPKSGGKQLHEGQLPPPQGLIELLEQLNRKGL